MQIFHQPDGKLTGWFFLDRGEPGLCVSCTLTSMCSDRNKVKKRPNSLFPVTSLLSQGQMFMLNMVKDVSE